MYNLFHFFLLLQVQAQWTSENYPNPSSEFQLCRIKFPSGLCDPDDILVKAARSRLEKELKLLEIKSRPRLYTAYPSHSNCDTKGIVVVLVLAKSIDGLSATEMANELLNKWNIDSECGKGVVIVISAKNKQWGIARGEHVPLHSEDFYDMFRDQKRLLQQTDYPTVISNVLLRIEEKSHQWERPRAVRGASKKKEQKSDQQKKYPAKQAPLWLKLSFWLIVFGCIVVPIFCCLCCAYFFCRGMLSCCCSE